MHDRQFSRNHGHAPIKGNPRLLPNFAMYPPTLVAMFLKTTLVQLELYEISGAPEDVEADRRRRISVAAALRRLHVNLGHAPS